MNQFPYALSRNHLYEISDAISSHLDAYFESGDPEKHESKYGTLTLLNESQCEIMKNGLGIDAVTTIWYPERLQKIKNIRASQNLPPEATQSERVKWQSGT